MSNEQDRELLELAAKAAGMEGWRYVGPGPSLGMAKMIDPSRPGSTGYVGRNWNPLHDDGDEARLEAALGMNISWGPNRVQVGADIRHAPAEYYEDHGGDKQAARRRAGVRAAAEIGRAMP